MWHLGTWFNGGLSNAESMVQLCDLGGLFQTRQFYGPLIL